MGSIKELKQGKHEFVDLEYCGKKVKWTDLHTIIMTSSYTIAISDVEKLLKDKIKKLEKEMNILLNSITDLVNEGKTEETIEMHEVHRINYFKIKVLKEILGE